MQNRRFAQAPIDALIDLVIGGRLRCQIPVRIDSNIIGVDSGWEMYIAGNGGIKTEVAHFFTKVKTAAEVLEYTGAFCELYRQEGWYLERTVHYVNRVGLDYVKKKILDDHEGRKALWERLQFALDGEPDPWFDFKEAEVDTRQFEKLSPA